MPFGDMRMSRPAYDDVSVTVTSGELGERGPGGGGNGVGMPKKGDQSRLKSSRALIPRRPHSLLKRTWGRKAIKETPSPKRSPPARAAGPFFSPLSLLRRGCFDPMQPPKSKSNS